MPRRNREIKLIFTVLAVFFVAFLAVPMIQVLMKSVMTDSGAGMTLANYAEVLTGEDFLKALGNSFVISTCSAVLTTTWHLSWHTRCITPIPERVIKD